MPGDGAAKLAGALVEADQQGLASHGLMQVETYLAHLAAGTVTPASEPAAITTRGAITLIDAGHMFGHLVAEIAIRHAIAAAREHGIGAAVVGHSFHFGAAGRYAEMAAAAGCIGICMSNSRAVMPAPGGAEPLVGTNPLAIAIPAGHRPPVVFDMATSEGSLAKIHMARAADQRIPEGWAVDAGGVPTTDPATALAGMLLPAAGAKGFGLSFVIDLITALLSGSALGPEVGPMRGELTRPLDCSHVFIAIDVGHAREVTGFTSAVDAAVDRVTNARRAPGTAELHVPGARKHARAQSAGDNVTVSPGVIASLRRAARQLGYTLPSAWTHQLETECR
jgi:LDH2 family malate/lactate/ureidoglycolate dehydrogenase